MRPYDKKYAYARVINNDECRKIYAKLERRGTTIKDIVKFKHALMRIPWEWNLIAAGGPKERKARRKKLAGKVERLADEIVNDYEADRLRIKRNTIFSDPMSDYPDYPSLSNLLYEVADYLNSLGTDEVRYELEKFRPPKQSNLPMLVQYAKRRVFSLLQELNTSRQAPNKDTATIVNVLFDLSDDEKIKPEDITQMRKKERRKYYT